MNDADDRLAALDPAAHQPYHHPDLDSMIARIVTKRGDIRVSRRQRLQVRLAGGLIGATLVTAVTLVLAQGASPLPALSLARALSNSPTNAGLTTAAPTFARDDVHFSAGPDISPTPNSRASYELRIPTDGSKEADRLGAVFGLTGVPKLTGPRNWSLTDGTGAVLNYESTGVPQWYYSSTTPGVAPATKSASASVAVPDHATLEADAQRYLVALGFNYALSSPSFSTRTTSTTTASGAPLSINSAEVTYVVDVHGVATDQSVSVSVNSANALLFAQGPAFDVSRVVRYPLRSPRAAVASLNSSERRLSVPEATTPPRANATLTNDELSLASYELTNGTVWLLPVYTYSGTVRPAEGGPTKSAWTVVALKPAYVVGPLVTSDAGG